MSGITQRDLFKYLTLRGKDGHTSIYHTQKELAESVAKVFFVSADNTRINAIIKGTKNGFSNLDLKTENIDTFYRELFDERTKNLSDHALKAMLSHAQNFAGKFDDCQSFVEDTFETYMKHMFTCALPRPTADADASDLQKQEPAPAYLLRQDSPAFHCTDFFAGRENFLKEIQKHLAQDRLVVLNGMGGIGKTTLAAQFANNNRPFRYASMQIVSSELQSSFEDVVRAVRFDGLKDEKEPPEQRYQKRLELLRQLDEQTLIIIDNADDPWTDIKEFYKIQREMRFHLIITSRLTEAFQKQFCLPVTPLSSKDQRELFLYHYCELDPKKQPDSPISDEESQILDEILCRIEGHTLLIKLVAKTMYNESATFEEMLEWVHGPKINYRFMDGGELKNPKDVARNLLFRAKLDDAQRNLLRRLAFLPTEGISRRLFLRRLCPANCPLSLLEGGSWVIREQDRIRVHPVIRDAVRDDMRDNHQLEWKSHTEFLELIRKAMETPDGLSKDDQTSLCRLVRSMEEALRDSKVSPELWDCLIAIAVYCRYACQYETALRLCIQLSKAEEDMADMNKRVNLHLEIGSLFQRLANYTEAINHYERALKRALDITQCDDDQLGSCYNSLGVIHRKNAEYEKARDYFEKALKCYKRDNLRATAQNDLGVVYMNLGKAEPDFEKSKAFYLSAKTNYEAALELREKLSASAQNADEKKKWARDLAFSHHNIGSALYRLGEYHKALKEHTEALRLRRENQLHDPDIAASLNWIGNDLMPLGRLPEAKEALDESLKIRQKVLGEHHPDLAWVLLSLSEYYERTDDLPLAIESAQRAFDIRCNQLRKKHLYISEAEQRLNELKKRAEESGLAI